MALSILAAIVLLAGPAGAAGSAPALLYDYEFKGTTGTVNNSAPHGPAASLALAGTWTPVPQGVYFSGDTSGKASVAYGRPASGYTLNVPASAAVGFGARIVYHAPASGTCFDDTPNITQIGRDGPGSAQAKLQLSSCQDSTTSVTAECRIAGALTAPGTPPVVGTTPLTNDDTYDVSCAKSPDRPDNTATIVLSVTDLTAGTQPVISTFTVAAVGGMTTTQFLSAGNKYPLPAPARNTDQFNGAMTRAVYCAGTPASVVTCLAAHLP